MAQAKRSGFRVCAQRCDQCLFSPDKIVGERRKKQVLKESRANQAYFICHKESIRGTEGCCRGFFDSYGWDIQLYQIASRLSQPGGYQYVIWVDSEGNEVEPPADLPDWAGNV
jgi:hypothetical protein